MYRQLFLVSFMALAAISATSVEANIGFDTSADTYDASNVIVQVSAQDFVADFTDLGLPQSEYVFDDTERLDVVYDELHERRFEDTRIG